MTKSYIRLMLIIVLAFVCAGCKNSETRVELLDETGGITEADLYSSEEAATEQISVDDKVAVYVCGAVKAPGVYYLGRHSLKKDALDLAGGFAKGAAKYYVNLAQPVSDGEQIYFPFETEIDSGMTNEILNNTSASTSAKSLEDASGELININTATKEELMTINGVGETRAEAIIKYRDEHGPFKDISDICNVSGIKDGLYNKIKDYITVD